MADLEPTNGEWNNLSDGGASKEGYYLVCSYGGTTVGVTNSVSYQLPPSTQSCSLSGNPMQVACK
jgi:hypothetical protein